MKLLFTAFIFVFVNSDMTSPNLTIQFSNLEEKYIGKNLYIGYWSDDKETFPEADKVNLKDKFTINNLKFFISKSLEENTYAISLFIDMNGNGKLDKNLFGVPKEPYCFSRNFKPKLSAPNFEDCSILISKDTKLTLELID